MSQANAGSTTPGNFAAPRQGFLAPDFSLQTNDGSTYTLSDLHGRPVLVNFWASWCPPCRSEMPALENVYQDYKGQGFIILAVNAANQDNPEQALTFTQELGLSFPILFDEDDAVSEVYQTTALPTSFFINADGTIQEVVVGGPMSEALLRVRVQQLLEGTP